MSGPEPLRFAATLYRVPVEGGYFLVDAGLPWEAGRLLRLLPQPPRLLFLTHHHLDHSGGALTLWRRFRLPILAHPQEWPYLTGERPRPPLPIPFLGRRLANLAPPLPREALRPAEEGMEVLGWRVVALPGHTLGQVGLLKEGVLLAGDALRGKGLPPRFINEDHGLARKTVRKILDLGAERILLGHGGPLSREEVAALARRLGV
ncbi:MAG: MBL fold metallo-hydrolase [Thermus sp.]|uniref:MBL fold metallo-hydrolase n=1 Tax=unclassified Thermus TaxID=2619321 RepID=UPI000238A1C4|nr:MULTISPECIES: MBL fold metallo-hydrolase [unclassified Thermus]AEV15069.1 Metal dependent hydrolase [Thermus sp. CCB_US3_UF1]MCS6869622.1 MBL fold metallo-hydrolase [Thermus sp.]MCS7217440.1 MBL fold metallo-hydrolase [Thermus sp.]MCX7848785.1 MBL fold metallo-hydrolase [Thermus sp.]MDW8016677.1 MBL fold metallo-hydrolase [Thermus sp.]